VRRVSPLHGVCAVKNLSLRPYGEEWCYAVPIPHIRHCSALRDTMYKEIAPCVALCLDDPWSRFFFFFIDLRRVGSGGQKSLPLSLSKRGISFF
jgi:hypothetical protein